MESAAGGSQDPVQRKLTITGLATAPSIVKLISPLTEALRTLVILEFQKSWAGLRRLLPQAFSGTDH